MQSQHDDPIEQEIAKLQKPMVGRRLFSWIFFLLFIFIFLIAPMGVSFWPSVFGQTHLGDYFAKSKNVASKSDAKSIAPNKKMGWDISWNPEPLSNSHQPWENDCKVCHSTPFERVKDKDCLACHKTVGDHVKRETAKISALHEVRCATCHREHKGEFGLAEQNKRYIGQQCVDCHANIKAVYANTKLENVSDFSSDHPEFQIQVNIENGTNKLGHIRQGDKSKVVDKTSLKFPHDVHLVAKGVRSPDGMVKMECADCHKPNSDGMNFQPITMKDNCQRCHALKFELAVPNRQVPHGSESQVLSTLREFYSYVSVNGVPMDQVPASGPISILRPGEKDPVGTFINTPGDVKSHAIAAATELFEKTSCVVCHDVTRLPGTGKKGTPEEDMPQWKITPVPAEHAWMPQALFNHRAHLTTQCVECHNAPKSKDLRDVMMPAINECRDCHVGKVPVKDKVTSDCGLCHTFHLPLSHPVTNGMTNAAQVSVTPGPKK